MKFSKLWWQAFFYLFLCYVNFGYSLRCYYCDSQRACESPQLYECNQTLANATNNYLDNLYANVTMNVTEPYQCFRDELKLSNQQIYYSSCIYANSGACHFHLKVSDTNATRSCTICDHRDGCNPAARIEITYFAIILSILVAYFLKIN